MLKYLSIALFLISYLPLKAQYSIEGQLINAQEEKLYGATIVLLNAADSTMFAFGVSNDDGKFKLTDVDKGKFILQLSYLGYSTLYEDLEVLDDSPNRIDIGILTLSESHETLNEVTIKAEHIPMGIRGDTISYNAAAFKTREGATVEDLLKKLPGIEVDRAGGIKAQGEDVENVLVDGKEFFGDDPLIATKNLEAEAIDKVEVFDKLSEIAEFTGIEDGQDEKTINLKLKEDHKKGGFGNINIQGGTKDSWLGKLNYNRFSPVMQASVIASGNSINEQAFSFNEYISFMGGLGNAIAAGGFNQFNNGFISNNTPEGLSKNYSIGTNLNYDISNKLQFFSNYFYNRIDKDLLKTTTGENFTTDRIFTSRDTNAVTNNKQNHRLNTKLIYKINPFNEIVFRNNFQGIFDNSNQSNETTNLEMGSLLSLTNANTDNDRDQKGIESHLQFKKKFSKKGRNWINSLSYKQANTTENATIQNEFYFINTEALINQDQAYLNKQKEFDLKSNYTEPLGKKTYLGLSYNLYKGTERPIKDFFDIYGQNKILNEDLSSIYDKSLAYNQWGISIRKNTKKVKLYTGLSFQLTTLDGIINDGAERINRQFKHLLPAMTLTYKVGRSKNLDLNYNTRINAPSLNQLMPLANNSDPNFLFLGNPNLIPEYSHNWSLSFNAYDQFSGTSFFTYLNVNFTENRIVNQVEYLNNLTSVVTPINSDHFLSGNASASFSSPIRKLKINTKISANLNYANYNSYINEINNRVGENQINLSFKVDNRKKKYLDIGAGFRLNYNSRSYSINNEFNQSFLNYDLFIEGDIFLTKTTTFSSSFDYKKYSGEFFSSGRNFSLWHAELSQQIAKGKWTVSIIARDILNENIGFSRYGSNNSLNESFYNTLSRYFMLGLKYKLGRKAKQGLEINLDS